MNSNLNGHVTETTDRLNFLKESFDKEYMASLVPHTSKQRARDPILQPATGRDPHMDFSGMLSSQTAISTQFKSRPASSLVHKQTQQTRQRAPEKPKPEDMSAAAIQRLNSRRTEIEAELDELEKLVLSRQRAQAEEGRAERPFAMY